ncbi:MAG TPA: glutamate racemase [Candidatus Angelobacter sp.]|nr:glutamate racemase [Candidatus Angelobacter sp.]
MAPVIGVFDSGFGGLTVLRELRRVLPSADYLYFGDTAHLPYGAKSVRTVAKYAIAAAHFLEQHKIEMLVVACNTATALAFDDIRSAVNIPVIGVVEPGAQRAAAISKSRQAVVIATEATISSHAYQKALRQQGLEATERACPLFVPLVEEGWVEHPVTEQVAHIYLDELFHNGARHADVLVLGCTHYPLLRPLLRRVVPHRVEIVDSAESTAAKVLDLLKKDLPKEDLRQKNPEQAPAGALRCYATDSVEKFKRLGSKFLACPISNVELVDIEK